MRISLLFAMAALLASCADTQYIVKPLKMPTPLNNLSEVDLIKQLECVSNETYVDVIKTYRREDTLVGIIKSTHPESQ